MVRPGRVATIGAAAWAIWCIALFLVTPRPALALASPTLTGQASTPALVGGSLTDTATLAGGAIPSGTITFQLFAGGGCGGSPVLTSTKTVNGNGNYTSDPYGPLVNGIYYSWVTSYGGDANNNPASTPLCDLAESVAVPQYCPSPPQCATPPGPCTGGGTMLTSSTTSCTGSAAHQTFVTTSFLGPQTICTGAGKTSGILLCPGVLDLNTNEETVSTIGAAIPTLSIWGVGALVAGLGGLALRRLRLPSRS